MRCSTAVRCSRTRSAWQRCSTSCGRAGPSRGPSCGSRWPTGSRHRRRGHAASTAGARAGSSSPAGSQRSLSASWGPRRCCRRARTTRRPQTADASPSLQKAVPHGALVPDATAKESFQAAVPASAGAAATPAPTGASPTPLTPPAPATGRLQDYQAWMRLRVTNTTRLSQVAQRSISLTRGFGGYVTRSDVERPGRAQRHRRDRRAHPDRARAGRDRALLEPRRDRGTARRRRRPAAQLRRRRAARRVAAALARADRGASRRPEGHARAARRAAGPARARPPRARGCNADDHRAHGARRVRAPRPLVLDGREAGRRACRQHESRFTHALHRVGGILETAAIGALYVVLLGGPILLVVALVLLGRRMRRRRSERELLARA